MTAPDGTPISEDQARAMDAIFALAKAVHEGGLTINDLMAVVRVAVEDGHDAIALTLSMARIAVEEVAEERAQEATP